MPDPLSIEAQRRALGRIKRMAQGLITRRGRRDQDDDDEATVTIEIERGQMNRPRAPEVPLPRRTSRVPSRVRQADEPSREEIRRAVEEMQRRKRARGMR